MTGIRSSYQNAESRVDDRHWGGSTISADTPKQNCHDLCVDAADPCGAQLYSKVKPTLTVT
jgi:hypothetical protein